jgi:hypothetical protein
MRRGRVKLFAVAVIAAFVAFAGVAYATTDHWFSGSLSSGLGYASAGSHSIIYVEGTSNTNGFCVAKDSGLAGYGPSSRTPAGVPQCASSGGFANRTENGACCYHGWISNGTGNNMIIDPSTHYTY